MDNEMFTVDEWQPVVVRTTEDTEDQPTDPLSEEDLFFLRREDEACDFEIADKTWWV